MIIGLTGSVQDIKFDTAEFEIIFFFEHNRRNDFSAKIVNPFRDLELTQLHNIQAWKLRRIALREQAF